MFGFLFLLICIVMYFLKESIENAECKKKYANSDGLTYIDSKGRSRLVSNNKLVFYTHDKNGDYILEDIGGYVYKNFSEEERQEQKNINVDTAIKNGKSTYCEDENEHKKDWYCKGRRFIDLKTGERYVIRCIQGKYYYMDISTGLLVRKTDKQLEEERDRSEEWAYNCKEIDMDKFNEKQKEINDKTMLYRDYDYNFRCDSYQ